MSERREHENMVFKSFQFMKQDGTEKYFDDCVATDFEKIGLLQGAKRRIEMEIDDLHKKRARVEEKRAKKEGYREGWGNFLEMSAEHGQDVAPLTMAQNPYEEPPPGPNQPNRWFERPEGNAWVQPEPLKSPNWYVQKYPSRF